MADEKKITGEILTESELDGVVGGSKAQSNRDADFLKDIGATDASYQNNDDPRKLQRAWAKMGVTFIENPNDGTNRYFNNGKQVSRIDALKVAAKMMRNNTINVLDYDI